MEGFPKGLSSDFQSSLALWVARSFVAVVAGWSCRAEGLDVFVVMLVPLSSREVTGFSFLTFRPQEELVGSEQVRC